MGEGARICRSVVEKGSCGREKTLERIGEETSLTKAEEQCETAGSNKQAILQAFQISGGEYQTQNESQTQKWRKQRV